MDRIRMTPSECPEAEHVAALAEGRTGPAEREQLLAHVRSCQDCFESYAAALTDLDAARALRSTPAGGRGLAWLALAAALLVAAVVALRPGESPGPPPRAASILWEATRRAAQAPAAGVAGTHYEAWPEHGPAGHGFTAGSGARPLRRLGVRLADVEWSRRFDAGSAAAAEALLRDEIALHAGADVTWARPALDGRADLAEMAPERLVPAQAEAREELSLGWLVEWCRLAARAGRLDLCPATDDAVWTAARAALDDPGASGPWEEVRRRLPSARKPGGEAAPVEQALRRLLEVIT